MSVGVTVRVVMVPVFELLALDFTVTAPLFVQLKQYNVPGASSPLGNVTTCPVTFVAVAMPVQAAPVAGHARLVVFTVKLAAVPRV
jgi:hypothetical protein